MLGCLTDVPGGALAARRTVAGRHVAGSLRRAARPTRPGVVLVVADRNPLLTSSVPAEVLGALLGLPSRLALKEAVSLSNRRSSAARPTAEIRTVSSEAASPVRCRRRTGHAEGCSSEGVPNLGAKVPPGPQQGSGCEHRTPSPTWSCAASVSLPRGSSCFPSSLFPFPVPPQAANKFMAVNTAWEVLVSAMHSAALSVLPLAVAPVKIGWASLKTPVEYSAQAYQEGRFRFHNPLAASAAAARPPPAQAATQTRCDGPCAGGQADTHRLSCALSARRSGSQSPRHLV